MFESTYVGGWAKRCHPAFYVFSFIFEASKVGSLDSLCGKLKVLGDGRSA